MLSIGHDELEEGAEPPIGRLYFLSPSEKKSLKNLLDEHLVNSFMDQSSFPHTVT